MRGSRGEAWRASSASSGTTRRGRGAPGGGREVVPETRVAHRMRGLPGMPGAPPGGPKSPLTGCAPRVPPRCSAWRRRSTSPPCRRWRATGERGAGWAGRGRRGTGHGGAAGCCGRWRGSGARRRRWGAPRRRRRCWRQRTRGGLPSARCTPRPSQRGSGVPRTTGC